MESTVFLRYGGKKAVVSGLLYIFFYVYYYNFDHNILAIENFVYGLLYKCTIGTVSSAVSALAACKVCRQLT